MRWSPACVSFAFGACALLWCELYSSQGHQTVWACGFAAATAAAIAAAASTGGRASSSKMVPSLRGRQYKRTARSEDTAVPRHAVGMSAAALGVLGADTKRRAGRGRGRPGRAGRTQAREVTDTKDSEAPQVVVSEASAVHADVEASQHDDNVTVLLLGFFGAIAFWAFVAVTQGAIAGAEWLSCYVIEYSLSVDNLFVFILIFEYFKLPNNLQTQVLNYGIYGAIFFRFIFIYLGAALLENANFLILVFAAILLYASYAGFTQDENAEEEKLEDNKILQSLRRVMDFSPSLDGDKFFTEISGKRVATPLLLCLLVIELSDIVFATDSVPAVLGTTQDPFIAYSSNVFAVFGLRSVYYLLKDAMNEFRFLQPAVNAVLGFIGVKIIVDYFHIIEVPVVASLAIVLSTLAAGVGLSVLDMQQHPPSKSEG